MCMPLIGYNSNTHPRSPCHGLTITSSHKHVTPLPLVLTCTFVPTSPLPQLSTLARLPYIAHSKALHIHYLLQNAPTSMEAMGGICFIICGHQRTCRTLNSYRSQQLLADVVLKYIHSNLNIEP